MLGSGFTALRGQGLSGSGFAGFRIQVSLGFMGASVVFDCVLAPEIPGCPGPQT